MFLLRPFLVDLRFFFLWAVVSFINFKQHLYQVLFTTE